MDIVWDVVAVVVWDVGARYLEPSPPIPLPLSRQAKVAEALLRNPHVQQFRASLQRFMPQKVLKFPWVRGVEVGADLAYATSPTTHAAQSKWYIGKAIKGEVLNVFTMMKTLLPPLKKAKFLMFISNSFKDVTVFLWHALNKSKLRGERRSNNVAVYGNHPVATPVIVQPFQDLTLPIHLHVRAECVSFRRNFRKTRRSERRHMRLAQMAISLTKMNDTSPTKHTSEYPMAESSETELELKITLPSMSSSAPKLSSSFRSVSRKKRKMERHHVRTVRILTTLKEHFRV
jgi:hypothetical protein